MRKILASLLFILVTFFGFAQSIDRCGVVADIQYQVNHNPAYIEGIQRAEVNAQKWLTEHANSFKNDGELTIPVVVHVVYYEDDEKKNIPDSRIHSQIQILNDAYRDNSPYANGIRQEFQDLRGDMKINFALASVDPDGNSTDGIVRHPTDKDGFDMLSEMNAWKHSATGGADAWPNNLYLNIWVAKLTFFGIENALLGIATFPATMSAEEGNTTPTPFDEDGVTINYNHMGENLDNPDLAPSNLGATAIHEVGHWLGLRHIWADEDDPFTGAPGPCEQDDFVYDTPMCSVRSNQSCEQNRNTCSNENEFSDGFWGTHDPPDMVENYMDYSADDCMAMFTKGQKERAWAFLVTARQDLFSSSGRNGAHFNAYAIKTESSCPSACDGTIDVYAYWGEAPYTYSLDGAAFQSESTFEGVCTGTHNVIVKDADGVEIDAVIVLESNHFAPEVSVSVQEPSCGSCADGSATVQILDGIPDYSFEWNTNPVQTGETASDLSAGTYVVTIVDGCGEVTEEEVIIGGTNIHSIGKTEVQLFPNPTKGVIYLQGIETGAVTVFNTLGEEIFTLRISSANQVVDLSDLPQGSYYVKIEGGDIAETHRVVRH